MIFLFFWVLGLAVGIVTTIFNRSLRDTISISNNLLFYQLTVTISLVGIVGFTGHVFYSDMVADTIGWARGSLFQKELGFAELSWAILGILCIWFKRHFWLATMIAVIPLLFGAAYIHVIEVIENHNFNSGNFITIIPDLLIPITLIGLSITGKVWK